MLSNIEQAVVDLLNAEESITVPNVFSMYMRIAGHDLGDSEKAVITFERAMDKHALRADVQSPMIEKLRNQYWYSKLGGSKDGDGQCQMCEQCGGLRLQDKKHRSSGIKASAPAKQHARRGEAKPSTPS